MEDSRHPDQRLLAPAVQVWWLNFLNDKPSDEVLKQEIVSNKPWKCEAAAELLRRNTLNSTCLMAIVDHVPECSTRAAEILTWQARMASRSSLTWLISEGLL